MANEPNNELQLEIKPEVAQGHYVNLALVTHSHSEFILDAAAMLPAMPKAQIVSRLIMTPDHAKQLMLALQDNVRKYEQAFGTIQIPQQPRQQGNTIAPFSIPKGEA